jgi:hypothetical protein
MPTLRDFVFRFVQRVGDSLAVRIGLKEPVPISLRRSANLAINAPDLRAIDNDGLNRPAIVIIAVGAVF